MRFTQDTGSNGYFIHSFTREGITVQTPGGAALQLNSSLILSSDRLITDWEPRSVAELLPSHLAAITVLSPEVVLIGTGPRQCFPPAALLIPLMEAGIGYEVMDSHAACRTYNILNSEGRRVVAALLLP